MELYTSMRNHYLKINSRLLAVSVCLGLLAGCAHQASAPTETQWASNPNSYLALGQDMQSFLAGAQIQSVAYFAQSPWGEQIDVTVQDRYFSGSGRECLRLELKPQAMTTRIALVCEQNGQWTSVRPVTQMLNAR